jgi:hypothetical protein
MVALDKQASDRRRNRLGADLLEGSLRTPILAIRGNSLRVRADCRAFHPSDDPLQERLRARLPTP